MIDLPDQAFLLNAAARGVQWGFLAAIVVAVITGLCLPFISSGVHQERRPVRRHW